MMTRQASEGCVCRLRTASPEAGGSAGRTLPQGLRRAGGPTGILVWISGPQSVREKFVRFRAAPGRLATGPRVTPKAGEEQDHVPCILPAARGSRSFSVSQAKSSHAYTSQRADFKPPRECSLASHLLLTNRMLREQISEVGSGDNRQSMDW